MSIQIEFRADFVPVGEASFLDPWYMANQIWAMLSDVISQWEIDLFRDERELWQDSERNDIQLFWFFGRKDNKSIVYFLN